MKTRAKVCVLSSLLVLPGLMALASRPGVDAPIRGAEEELDASPVVGAGSAEELAALVVHWGASPADRADGAVDPRLLELPPDGVYTSSDGVHFFPDDTAKDELVDARECTVELAVDAALLDVLDRVHAGEAKASLRLAPRRALADALGLGGYESAAGVDCYSALPPNCRAFDHTCPDPVPPYFVKRCVQIRIPVAGRVCSCFWWFF